MNSAAISAPWVTPTRSSPLSFEGAVLAVCTHTWSWMARIRLRKFLSTLLLCG